MNQKMKLKINPETKNSEAHQLWIIRHFHNLPRNEKKKKKNCVDDYRSVSNRENRFFHRLVAKKKR